MIGIIGAMQEEIDEILKLMHIDSEEDINGFHFYKGTLSQKDIVLVKGGIGKVNATISTVLMILHYKVDYLINMGTAGGIKDDEEVGDIVISERIVHHDFDLTGFGREMGQVPDLPLYFEADKTLIDITKRILEENHIRAYTGLIASGDQFIHSKPQVDHILKYFPDTLCCEMEAASIAQTCTVLGVPFIITRGLSDIYNKGDNHMQFDEYVRHASKVSAMICEKIAEYL